MIAFSIGFIHIYRYGIFYAISFILGYIWLSYCGRYFHNLKINTNLTVLLSHHLDDLMLMIMGGVLIGGRAGHVLIYNSAYYRSHPLESFFFWEGGMSFIGGFIGVTIALLIVMRIHQLSRRDLLILSDMLMMVLPLGIILGRLGNFLNQELVGLPLTTLTTQGRSTLATTLQSRGLTHIYTRVDQLERVNTNFLSIALEGLCLRIIVIIAYRQTYAQNIYRPGLLTGLFMTGYCIVRFGLEYLRQDSNLEFVGALTISQYYFVIGAIVGIFFIIKAIHSPSRQ